MKKKHLIRDSLSGYLRRVLFIMKLTILIFFCGLISVHASVYSQATKLSLELEEVSIVDVIREIESKSEFVFIYKNNVIDPDKRVDVKVEGSTVEEILDKVLSDTGITYEILNKQIILTPEKVIIKKEILPLPEKQIQPKSPQKKVSGTVTDEAGLPLPGVTILVKGTTSGTVTDMDGEFVLEVPITSGVLQFSFIGFDTKDIPIAGKDNFKVVLKESVVGIDEVVVVGFGVQKKESVVGAISQVKGSELEKIGVTSVANALVGQVPGMVTVQQSGLPGSSEAKIFIRGVSTFAGNNEPLYIVDGVERPITDIDPNEVESISVLKDASATAVYGVKGANGVIILTTKRGQKGRMSISVDAQYTLSKPTVVRDLGNSYETLTARNQYYRYLQRYSEVLNDEIMEHYRLQDMPYVYPDASPADLVLNDFGKDYKATVAARGGTDVAKYYISMGFLHEGGFVTGNQDLYNPNFSYNRYNFRANLDFDLTKSTSLSISSGGFIGVDSRASNDFSKNIRGLMFVPPYESPIIYPESFIEQYPDPNWPNTGDRYAASLIDGGKTYYYNFNNTGTDITTRDRLNTDITLKQDLDFITKGLSFQTMVSYNTSSAYRRNIRYTGDSYIFKLLSNDEYIWERYIGTNKDDESIVRDPYETANSRLVNPSYSLLYSARINYNRSFGSKHNVSALALFQRRESHVGAAFKHFEENWVGRATYDYKEKYLIEGNLGISGSEQFSPDKRFGVFPAIALGWNIAKESFMEENFAVMNNLKVRYSYGETGNDNTGSNWLYIAEYTNGPGFSTGDLGSSESVQTIKEDKVANLNAQWERSIKNNLGIELGLWDNTFTATLDLFNEKRDKILMSRRALADWFGQSIQPLNIGATKVHGYEITAGFNKMHKGTHYWVKGNFNFNENRVVLRDDPKLTPDYLKLEGKPIGQSTTRKLIGYYQDMDEMINYSLNQSLSIVGSDKALDFNGDGVLNSLDNIPIGNPDQPMYTYGLSAGFSKKGFDFSFLVQGAHHVSRWLGAFMNPLYNMGEGEKYFLFGGREDIWTPDNRDAEYATWGGWNSSSEKAIADAKYVRLKSVELGYQIDKKHVKFLGLSSARIYFQGSNLLTYAPGISFFGDPELQPFEDNTGESYGLSGGSYPVPKRFTFGLKVNF